MKWHSPLDSWVKCNLDGSFKDNGMATCGGVIRDS